MFNKKYVSAWLGMAILVVGALAVVSYLQWDTEPTAEAKLRGITGHTLYKIHENLTAITDGDPLSEAQLAHTRNHLLVAGVYAESIDFSLNASRPQLAPLFANMANIAAHLDSQRLANPAGWLADNEAHYDKLLEAAKAAKLLIGQVYYEPDSTEGARARLAPHNPEVLASFNEELSDYIASLPAS